MLAVIGEHLRGFVATTFEQLSRQWVAHASQKGELPFQVQHIGSHWSREVQVDVVGINWENKASLIGECKWETDTVARETVTDLIETKMPRLVRLLPDEGAGWSIHYAFFGRAGFTPAARALAKEYRAVVVDLTRLDKDLSAQDRHN